MILEASDHDTYFRNSAKHALFLCHLSAQVATYCPNTLFSNSSIFSPSKSSREFIENAQFQINHPTRTETPELHSRGRQRDILQGNLSDLHTIHQGQTREEEKKNIPKTYEPNKNYNRDPLKLSVTDQSIENPATVVFQCVNK